MFSNIFFPFLLTGTNNLSSKLHLYINTLSTEVNFLAFILFLSLYLSLTILINKSQYFGW